MSIPPKELVKGSKWPINGDSLETKRSLSNKFNNEASIGTKKMTVAMNHWDGKSDGQQLKIKCIYSRELSQRNNYKFPIRWYKKQNKKIEAEINALQTKIDLSADPQEKENDIAALNALQSKLYDVEDEDPFYVPCGCHLQARFDKKHDCWIVTSVQMHDDLVHESVTSKQNAAFAAAKPSIIHTT